MLVFHNYFFAPRTSEVDACNSNGLPQQVSHSYEAKAFIRLFLWQRNNLILMGVPKKRDNKFDLFSASEIHLLGHPECIFRILIVRMPIHDPR